MMENQEGQIRVMLIRSTIGRPENQKKIVAGLGLKKMQRIKTLPNTASVRGMIRKVEHLVQIV